MPVPPGTAGLPLRTATIFPPRPLPPAAPAYSALPGSSLKRWRNSSPELRRAAGGRRWKGRGATGREAEGRGGPLGTRRNSPAATTRPAPPSDRPPRASRTHCRCRARSRRTPSHVTTCAAANASPAASGSNAWANHRRAPGKIPLSDSAPGQSPAHLITLFRGRPLLPSLLN